MISKKASVLLLIGMTAVLILVELWLSPILQPQVYHNFADQRSGLGIPNIWNVLPNIFFALAGFWGLYVFKKENLALPWMGVSIGLILTAVGSAYYHLEPDDARLVWDRLPMTIVFMSLVAALISERIQPLFGLYLWPLLLLIGFYSVIHWQIAGDLRFYLGLQAFTLLSVLILMLVHKSWNLLMVVIFYVIALFFDQFDHQIFKFTQGLISGHTLKHIVAALAGAWIFNIRRNER